MPPAPLPVSSPIAVFMSAQSQLEAIQALGLQPSLDSGSLPAFSSGVTDFTPAATPTDVAALTSSAEDRVIFLKSVTVSAVADAPSLIEVRLQRSPNGGGGTVIYPDVADHDYFDASQSGAMAAWTANRASGGNGISSSRPLITSGYLQVGTENEPAPALHWVFGGEAKSPCIRSLIEWIVVNLAGQTLPSGFKMAISFTWAEASLKRCVMVGDSTTSNAIFLFRTLARYPGIPGLTNTKNQGSNGFRLYDYINNTNSVTYPLTATRSVLQENYTQLSDLVVLRYGLNDVRQGVTHSGDDVTAEYVTSLLQEAVNALILDRPKIKIILHGPNPLTTDGNGSNFVVLAGAWDGMDLPTAAQAITDLLYDAYEAMRGYPGVYDVIQVQDLPEFGRTCKTVAESGLMTDILHPNNYGQKLIAEQIAPYLLE